MSLVWANRVMETTTTTGTGALTLAAAVTGYQRFSAACSTNDTVYYAIEAVDGSNTPTGDWEAGLGTYSSANTLTRTTVLASSNAGAAVSFAAGTKRVMLTPEASRFNYSSGGWETLTTAQADAGNSGTSETDIFTYTVAAAKLAIDGDHIEAQYAGVFVSSGTATRQIKVKFAGTAILDTGALTISLAAAWDVFVTLIRVSSSVVRYAISLTTEGAALAAYTSAGELTGLTLSGTNILKLTGQAGGVGAATNDIVGKLETVAFHPLNPGLLPNLPLASASGGSAATTAAAAATNFGLGTGDSPQFAGVNIGHASDTTLTRVSAGVVSVESINVLLELGVLHVRDEKTATTDAGGFTSAAWRTRVLNTTVTNTITSASLASNQISLPAGTYDVWARSPAFRVNHHQAKLANITDAADIRLGSTSFSQAANGGNIDSIVEGRFTIAGTKTIELQHQCTTNKATDGLGSGSGNSWGTAVFAEVLIKRVA